MVAHGQRDTAVFDTIAIEGLPIATTHLTSPKYVADSDVHPVCASGFYQVAVGMIFQLDELKAVNAGGASAEATPDVELPVAAPTPIYVDLDVTVTGFLGFGVRASFEGFHSGILSVEG